MAASHWGSINKASAQKAQKLTQKAQKWLETQGKQAVFSGKHQDFHPCNVVIQLLLCAWLCAEADTCRHIFYKRMQDNNYLFLYMDIPEQWYICILTKSPSLLLLLPSVGLSEASVITASRNWKTKTWFLIMMLHTFHIHTNKYRANDSHLPTHVHIYMKFLSILDRDLPSHTINRHDRLSININHHNQVSRTTSNHA